MATSGQVRDFRLFWVGQSISNLGSSVSAFAIPLIIFELTGSAFNLGIASVSTFLPYLLFGLVIGAWVDRVDRRRLMVWADIGRAAIVATIPLLAAVDALHVWWIYVAGFATSTVGIAFDAAQFAAIPSLVVSDDLVTANGRIQATYSAASVAGPLMAGVAVSIGPTTAVFAIDALSFLVSAGSLLLIRRSFNTAGERDATNVRADMLEGLRYVWGHPLLRSISIMMALINLIGSTLFAQLVLFAHERLSATNGQVALLFAADSAGVVVIALMAGRLRRRWSFGRVALGALTISGLLVMLFAAQTSLWIALPIWALHGGVVILFNINSGSMRQAIVPNHLLGRVISVAGVLAWSAIPIGSFAGGLIIERTGAVAWVYGAIGLLTVMFALSFSRGPIGHSERYLSPSDG